MKIKDFEEAYTEKFKCRVSYYDALNHKIQGTALGLQRKKGKHPCVLVDSYHNPIPLTRINDITVTNQKW